MPTFASLFSGIGAPDLAAERLGLKHLWMCEIAPFPRKVLAHRFPGVKVYDDIRRLHARGECVQLAERGRRAAGLQDGADGRAALIAGAGCPDCCERPDILWASPPCQDLSIAGKRAGIAGARSGLFWDFHRLAGELQPTWILMEQVPGLFSSNGGRDFNEVISALDELGYGLAWRVLDSRYLGVPQRRRRVYLVGRFGEPCPAEVLFESESGGGDIAAGGAAGEELAGTLGGGTPGARGWRGDLDTSGAYIPVLGATLKANTGRNHVEQDYIVESLALRGRDGGATAEMGGDQAFALRAAQGGGDKAFVMRMREGKDGGGKGPLIREDESLTLATANDQTLFISENQRAEVRLTEYARQLTSGGGKPGQGYPAVMVTSGPKMFDASGYHRESVSEDVTPTIASYEQPMWVSPSVRRLTPTECERLQGFPDSWTCLCAEECKCADGPRYAALGNAVTANAAEWVIGRVVAAV